MDKRKARKKGIYAGKRVEDLNSIIVNTMRPGLFLTKPYTHAKSYL